MTVSIRIRSRQGYKFAGASRRNPWEHPYTARLVEFLEMLVLTAFCHVGYVGSMFVCIVKIFTVHHSHSFQNIAFHALYPVLQCITPESIHSGHSLSPVIFTTALDRNWIIFCSPISPYVNPNLDLPNQKSADQNGMIIL